MINKLVDDNMERIQSDIDSLEPKDRVKAMIDLMRFVLPTLKAVEKMDSEIGVRTIEITLDKGPQENRTSGDEEESLTA